MNNELLNRQQQPPLPLNNITENETNPSTMSWLRDNAATSSGASIITRMMGDCVISTDWTGVNMDVFTRLRQMDVDAMKASRPKVLFSTGDAMAYSIHFKAFQDATSLNTVTFSDKLAEMLH